MAIAEITSHVSIQYEVAPTYDGWRCLHMAEGGYQNETNVPNPPEVRPSENARPIMFTEEMQLLAKAVMNRTNTAMTDKNITDTFGTHQAFCNNQGFGDPQDPRANYITKENLKYELPKLMKALICGGMFIRGIAEGNILRCVPGVHGINANGVMPTVDTVLKNNWYFHALYVRDSDKKLAHFPMGQGGQVIVPYFLREEVTYPPWWFERWNKNFLPNPLGIYR